MAFAKFEGNRFKIDGEIAGNHAILVIIFNLTASIVILTIILYPTNKYITDMWNSAGLYPVIDE